MNIKYGKTIICVVISMLISDGFYFFSESENKEILALGSLLFLGTTSVMAKGISFQDSFTSDSLQRASVRFFILGVLSNIFFTVRDFDLQLYLIVNGILFLIYGLIIFSIFQSKRQSKYQSKDPSKYKSPQFKGQSKYQSHQFKGQSKHESQ